MGSRIASGAMAEAVASWFDSLQACVRVDDPGRRDERGATTMSQRKLRVGMVGGGGPANFFGGPHRRAILMDNSAELTAGALRSKPSESIESARELFIPRGYP